jgi:putative ABC transport system substrate-binding protein
VTSRRIFLVTFAGGILIAPLAAEAQQPGKAYRIGYVGNSSPSLEPKLLSAFRDGLRDLGYVEGQNILIEYRWAEGSIDSPLRPL